GVRELADLVSLSAQIHAEDGAESAESAARALWLAATVAVAAGPSAEHESAKEALRRADPDAASRLVESATETARRAGIAEALARAADSIGFAAEDVSNRG